MGVCFHHIGLPSSIIDSPLAQVYDDFVDGGIKTMQSDIELFTLRADVENVKAYLRMLMLTRYLEPVHPYPGIAIESRLLAACSVSDDVFSSILWLRRVFQKVNQILSDTQAQTFCVCLSVDKPSACVVFNDPILGITRNETNRSSDAAPPSQQDAEKRDHIRLERIRSHLPAGYVGDFRDRSMA